MKTKIFTCILTVLSLLTAGTRPALAQGTAFTYQGRLNFGANAANGSYDLTFSLFNALSGPAQVGTTVTNSATAVSNGLFTVTLDFGANFPGANRWLEIGVRTNGNGAFSTLAPRQALAPTPYAIYAGNAASAITAAGVSANAVTAGGIQDGTITAAKVAGGQVVKTLNGLTDTVSISAGANVTLTTNGNILQVASSGGATSGWALGGNAGTTSSNFLGTTDNSAFELRANSQRALRLEPNAIAPNVIGGYFGNVADNNAHGATIGGGGAGNVTNRVSGNWGTISGGRANYAYGDYSTIAGGDGNSAGGESTIGGGSANSAGVYSVVGGGTFNNAAGINATIPGGSQNTASGTGSFAAGVNANATHNNSFVWGDGSQAANSTGPNRFEVNAFGGVNFYTGSSRVGLSGSAGLDFGANVRQMINLYNDGTYLYGIGVQNSTLYQRAGTGGGFAWYSGGVHTNAQNNAGGGVAVMVLDGQGDLTVPGTLVVGTTPFTAIVGSSSGNKGVYGVTSAAGPNYAGVWGESTAPSGGTGVVAKAYGTGSTGIYAYGPGLAGYFDGNIQVQGTATVKVLTITGGSDVAEPFEMSASEIPKGSVVSIDEEHPGNLKVCDAPYDTRVAGIVSGANGINPGLSLRQAGVMEGSQNVALSGRVYVLADASNGPIKPGDLLTTSQTPGHAMKVSDHARSQGAVIGKAMTSLNQGKGMVLVLVTLQ